MEADSHDTAFAGLPADLPPLLRGAPPAAAAAALLSLAHAAAARLPGVALRIAAEPDERLAARGGGLSVRARPADAPDAASPHLFADATPESLDVGVAAGDGEAAARLRRALLGPEDGALRGTCAELLAHGWSVTGAALPDAADGSLPEALRPWLVRRGLRAHRRLAWTDRLAEAALADEVADLWRAVLPLLRVMRAEESAAPRGDAR